jgi:phage terminase large subunit-like protein
MTDVCNSINRGEPSPEPDGYDNTKYKIIVAGTPLYQDSLIPRLQRLAGRPGEGKEWTSVEFKLCDDRRKSFWVDWMSDENVEALYQSHVGRDELDKFEREYRCQFIGPDTARFKKTYFRYYHYNSPEYTRDVLEQLGLYYEGCEILQIPEDEINGNEEYFRFVQVDLASTTNIKSNLTASTAMAANRISNKILLREIISGKFTPDELTDTAISQCLRTKSNVLGCEFHGVGDWGKHQIQNELSRRFIDSFIRLIELKSGNKKKEQRALMTLPYFKQGLVYINVDYAQLIVPDLLLVPLNSVWDRIDSMSYFPFTLENESQYMLQDIGILEKSQEEIEAEYDMLPEDESPVPFIYMRGV